MSTWCPNFDDDWQCFDASIYTDDTIKDVDKLFRSDSFSKYLKLTNCALGTCKSVVRRVVKTKLCRY